MPFLRAKGLQPDLSVVDENEVASQWPSCGRRVCNLGEIGYKLEKTTGLNALPAGEGSAT